MARKDQKTVTVAVTEDQAKTIEARLDSWVTSKTARVTDDLETYWSVLRIGMERVRQVLTSDEAKVILEVQNGAAVLGIPQSGSRAAWHLMSRTASSLTSWTKSGTLMARISYEKSIGSGQARSPPCWTGAG